MPPPVTFRFPVKVFPAAFGWKVTLILQLLPTPSTVGQLPRVAEYAPPEVLTKETGILTPLRFVTVTDKVRDPLAFTVPKSRFAGIGNVVALTGGVAGVLPASGIVFVFSTGITLPLPPALPAPVPTLLTVPVSGIVVADPAALCEMTSEAVFVPTVLGINNTVTAQVPLGATVPQVSEEIEKLAAFAPANATSDIIRSALPLFLTVIVLGAGAAPPTTTGASSNQINI